MPRSASPRPEPLTRRELKDVQRNARVAFERWVARYGDRLTFDQLSSIPSTWMIGVQQADEDAREQARLNDPRLQRRRERARARREARRGHQSGGFRPTLVE